jgi:hypothetical protein
MAKKKSSISKDDLFGYADYISNYNRDSGYSSYGGYGGYGSGYGRGSYLDLGEHKDYMKRQSSSRQIGGMDTSDIIFPDIDYYTEKTLQTVVNRELNKMQVDGKEIPHEMRVPEFMIRDVFKQYYNQDIKYQMKKDTYWWKDTLSSVDNYMMKVCTKKSIMNSAIITKHIAITLQEEMMKNPDWEQEMNNLNEEAKSAADEAKKENGQRPGEGEGQGESKDGNPNGESNGNGNSQGSGNGDGQSNSDGKLEGPKDSGGNQTQRSQVSDVFPGLKESIDKAMEKAAEEIRQKEELANSISGLDPHKSADDLSTLETINDITRSDKMTVRSVNKFVKKTIKGFKSALSGAISEFEEPLLDADSINDLVEVEYLGLEYLIDDINVKNSEASIKFDLYIDKSGSMSSSIELENGKRIARMDLAKVLAFQMNRLGILNNVYKFDNKLYKMEIGNIFGLSANGGTQIDICVEKIVQTKIPSVVLTDGDDNINIYDDNVYVLGLDQGIVRSTEASIKMANKGKLALFSSGKIFKGRHGTRMFEDQTNFIDHIEYDTEV